MSIKVAPKAGHTGSQPIKGYDCLPLTLNIDKNQTSFNCLDLKSKK